MIEAKKKHHMSGLSSYDDSIVMMVFSDCRICLLVAPEKEKEYQNET